MCTFFTLFDLNKKKKVYLIDGLLNAGKNFIFREDIIILLEREREDVFEFDLKKENVEYEDIFFRFEATNAR